MSHGISTSHSPEMYKLKKTIRELKSKTGRGTELISLYVPPKKRTSDIISYLREEYGIKILTPDERIVKKPLIWSGTIKN